MSVPSPAPDQPDQTDHPDQTDQPERRRPERMPTRVKWLVGILWFQTALNALGAVLLFLGARYLADHGEEGAGPLVGIGVVSLVVAALLAVSAIAMMHGRSWGWVLTMVLEMIAVIGGMVVVFTQGIEGIIAIGIAGGLISLLGAPETRQWCGRR